VAINAQWQTQATLVGGTNGTVNTFYTVPSSTSATFAYARDLVINNSGAQTLFVTMNPTSTTCTSAASFQIPAGGTIILSQCQVPGGAVVGVAVGGASGVTSVSLGYALNVAYV
jgi:hypothetical protein